MVGRVDDIIKGAIYGIYAMAEIVKEIPDARLTTEIKYYWYTTSTISTRFNKTIKYTK